MGVERVRVETLQDLSRKTGSVRSVALMNPFPSASSLPKPR